MTIAPENEGDHLVLHEHRAAANGMPVGLRTERAWLSANEPGIRVSSPGQIAGQRSPAATILLISSDPPEMITLADHIVVMYEHAVRGAVAAV